MDYWNRHNVTDHHQFASAEESVEYFHWRNAQYPNYIELMPVSGFDGQRVLDFGCGPGHDLVGFGTCSAGATLAGVDVSARSVEDARRRLALHGIRADLLQLAGGQALPFEDGSFDHVHCSGVLHHLADPVDALKEIKRVLTPHGTANVMVYNYNSLWLHLKVAYQRTLVQGLYPGLSLRDQFAKSTDGEDCPISNCYRPDEWIAICESAGLRASFAGAAVSLIELSLLNDRFAAMMDPRLPTESRAFLGALEFDQRLLPLFDGHHAGIDGVYRLSPA